MALVDYKRNFIFIHIYKTGGNSLRDFLGKSDDCEEVHGVHIEAKDLKNHFYNQGKQEFWDNAFKFSICAGLGLLLIPFLSATWLLVSSSKVMLAVNFIIYRYLSMLHILQHKARPKLQ